MLLDEGSRIDPSDDNNYAIRMSCRDRHYEVVNLLLKDARIDPSAEDNYCIRTACSHGHLEIVDILSDDRRVDKKVGLRSVMGCTQTKITNMEDNRKDNFGIGIIRGYS